MGWNVFAVFLLRAFFKTTDPGPTWQLPMKNLCLECHYSFVLSIPLSSEMSAATKSTVGYCFFVELPFFPSIARSTI